MVQTLWDSITEFLSPEAGQRRRAALDEFGRDIGYYVPPEMRGILGMVAEATPTASIDRASQSAVRMVQPGRTMGQRVGDLGGLLSETAGVVAPAMVAPRAGMTAAQAAQEMFMMPAAGVDDAARQFMVDDSGALRFFHGGLEMIQKPRATIDPEGLLEGFSVTPRRGVAERYAAMRGGNAVTEFEVDQNNLRPISEFDLYDLQNKIELDMGLDEGDLPDADLLAELRSLGYNAVEYSDPEFGLRVLDPSILTPVTPPFPAPRNEAEAMARNILEMRAAGRAGDVTEEMRAAADPMYMYQNTPLPMDEVSRMARAGEMGFDTPLYHGTFDDIRALDRFEGSAEGGPGAFFSTDEARVANTYTPSQAGRQGQNVMPLLGRTEGYSEAGYRAPFPADGTDAEVEQWLAGLDRFNRSIDYRKPDYFKSAIDAARRKDAPGAVIRQVEDDRIGGMMTTPSDVYITLDPTTLRSRFALFDPEFRHLRNLSAGIGGLGLLSLPQDEEMQ